MSLLQHIMVSKLKAKGYRNEIRVRDELRKYGLEVVRQPLSGGLISFPHDLCIRNFKLYVEVKSRKGNAGFKQLNKWKGSADILALPQEHDVTLCVVDINFIADLLCYRKELENEKRNTKDS